MSTTEPNMKIDSLYSDKGQPGDQVLFHGSGFDQANLAIFTTGPQAFCLPSPVRIDNQGTSAFALVPRGLTTPSVGTVCLVDDDKGTKSNDVSFRFL